MPKGPGRGRADYLELGDYNAVCAMCGRKRKASMLERNWQGQYRCPEHNESRQPQDFARGVPETMGVPWVQPFNGVSPNLCTYNGLSAFPGLAEPGCMIPGRSTVDPSVLVPYLPSPPAPPGPMLGDSDGEVIGTGSPNEVVGAN